MTTTVPGSMGWFARGCAGFGVARRTTWFWAVTGLGGLAAWYFGSPLGSVAWIATVSLAVWIGASANQPVLKMKRGPMLIAIAVAVLLQAAIVGLTWRAAVQTAPVREVVGEVSPPDDAALREAMAIFVDLSAVPASDALAEIWQSAIGMERDPVSARSFSTTAAILHRTKAKLLSDLSTRPYTQDLMAEGFCAFFDAYFEGVRWFDVIAERNGFALGSAPYRVWDQYNRKFLDHLQDLMKDSKFSVLRTRCAKEAQLRELSGRERP